MHVIRWEMIQLIGYWTGGYNNALMAIDKATQDKNDEFFHIVHRKMILLFLWHKNMHVMQDDIFSVK